MRELRPDSARGSAAAAAVRVPPEPIYRRIGRNIRRQRLALGWTIEQLGLRLKHARTRQSVNNVELGTERLLVHMLDDYARALRVDVTELLKEGR